MTVMEMLQKRWELFNDDLKKSYPESVKEETQARIAEIEQLMFILNTQPITEIRQEDIMEKFKRNTCEYMINFIADSMIQKFPNALCAEMLREFRIGCINTRLAEYAMYAGI